MAHIKLTYLESQKYNKRTRYCQDWTEVQAYTITDNMQVSQNTVTSRYKSTHDNQTMRHTIIINPTQISILLKLTTNR